MIGQWRLILQQAEQALRSERLEEALELISQPGVAEHRQAGQLRNRIAGRLVDRADEHLRQGHSNAAWRDLRLAELVGAPSVSVESVRARLTECGVADARSALDADCPSHAVALLGDIRARGADPAEVRRLHDGAVAWREAVHSVALGEFARAASEISTATKLIGDCPALVQKQSWIEENRARAMALRGQIQDALVAKDWPKLFKSAQSFLEIAAECRDVRDVRDEAMRRLGVHVANGTSPWPRDGAQPSPFRGAADERNGQRGRLLLWLDGSGGYLVCLGNSVAIGQAHPGTSIDVPILGDLSRNHATVIRDGEGYSIRSDREAFINRRAVHQSPLQDGDLIRLGRSVELKFSLPCSVSGTARLVLVSSHRLHLSLAGILLMADTCVLGNSPQAHVRVSDATGHVVLFRQGDAIWCRGEGELIIDGQTYQGRGQLRLPSRAVVGNLSFSLEPLNSSLV